MSRTFIKYIYYRKFKKMETRYLISSLKKIKLIHCFSGFENLEIIFIF